MRRILVLVLAATVAVSVSASADDRERVEGVVTEVHPRDFVLRACDRGVLIDMSELGGITMAIEVGESLAAVGSIDSGGQTLHAVRLEMASHTESPARP